MNVKSVESTTLAAIGYDETREILQLEFRSHSVYRYFGVPMFVYEALVAAGSKGRYFNGTIRGHFPYALETDDAGRRGES
jgi:KTSC domain